MYMNADREEVTMIKGKRTKRPKLSSPLELTTATTSSSSTAAAGAVSHVMGHGVSDGKTPSLSNSASELTHDDKEDIAYCLIPLAKGQTQRTMSPQTSLPPAGEVCQCKTCSKSFASFQALGGHRASHKKPSNKPFLTLGDQREIKQEHFQSNQRSTILSLQIANKITRVHECSLCGVEFASGQALGGHMRRHRPIPAAAVVRSSSQMDESTHREVKRERNMLLSLDLNMPAPEEDQPAESKFAFAPKEQVIVFLATPLIDCHY